MNRQSQQTTCSTPPNWSTVSERIKAEQKSQAQIREIRNHRPFNAADPSPLGASHPVSMRRRELDNELIQRLGLEGE